MQDYTLGYREVIPDQTLPIKWKEFILDTGCTQSTLQDIKGTERAGGYTYKDCTKNVTRNRFIYWRICQDTLELVELSLDLSLTCNHLRYRFTDTPLLDGLTIHEVGSQVVVLVATVSSVHRLSYPHPDRQDYLSSSGVVPSIFAEATLAAARDPHSFHVITRPNSTANAPLPNACCTWLADNQEAVFVLACSTGSMAMIRLDPLSGFVSLCELKEAGSMMPRLFSNFAEALRGRPEEVTTLGMVLHAVGPDMYLFCLGSDGNLRAWNTRNTSRVMATEVLVTVKQFPGFQPHMLRKCEGPNQQLCLAVYLSFSNTGEFIVLKPLLKDGTFVFANVVRITADEYVRQQCDLVDTCLSPHRLWAAWRTVEGGTAVASARWDAAEPPRWQKSALEELPCSEPHDLGEPTLDPKQAYLAEIFYPGKFPLAVITKALGIYQRSPHIQDASLSGRVLRDTVCQAVDAAIYQQIKDYDTTDEDFLEVSHQQWARLYTNCCQYYLAGDKPVGLAVLGSGGLVLVKKQRFSVLRPMGALEHLSGSEWPGCEGDRPPPGHRLHLGGDEVLHLLRLVKELDRQLPEEVGLAFDREVSRLRSPEAVAAELATEVMRGVNDETIMDTNLLGALIQEALTGVPDMYRSMGLLVEVLAFSPDPAQPTPDRSEQATARLLLNIGTLYSSPLGSSVIAQSLLQVLNERLVLCRGLLLLDALMRKVMEPSQGPRDADRGVVLHLSVVTRAIWVVRWACSSPVLSRENRGLQRSLTMGEAFLQQCATGRAHRVLADGRAADTGTLALWHRHMLDYVDIVGSMLWPIGEQLFPDYLLNSGQLIGLQGWVRLLGSWCENSRYSSPYLLGCVSLRLGNPAKALHYFKAAAAGATRDPYIIAQLGEPNLDRTLARYYLVVVGKMEECGYSQCVVDTATAALLDMPPDEPAVPTFHSLLFNHHLLLRHYDDAYTALVGNPEEERRKDFLRKLVDAMVREGRLTDLLSFPYVGLLSQLEDMLQSRAQAVNVAHSSVYYHLLFALHERRGNWRRAAAVAYEQAVRLDAEQTSLKLLELQRRQLLVCVATLGLIGDPDYRWLTKPTLGGGDDSGVGEPDASMETSDSRPEVAVIELADIRRELELVSARVTLVRLRPTEAAIVTGKGWSAEELVGLLTNARLFVAALRLCSCFKLSAERPLEGLAASCVQLQQESTEMPWNWLAHNQIEGTNQGEMTAQHTAWRLLETQLATHEAPGDTKLHRAVLTRLLRLACFPPCFLLASYKLRNPPELVRVYLTFGRLREAADIACEYLHAILGRGSEYFGVSETVLSGRPACLPLNTLDRLLYELNRPKYKEECENLQGLINYYIQTGVRAS